MIKIAIFRKTYFFLFDVNRISVIFCAGTEKSNNWNQMRKSIIRAVGLLVVSLMIFKIIQ